MADLIAQPATNLVVYTVSELAFALRRTVEDNYGLVKLRGEISGFKGQHTSGHCYFTLKDDKACIEAVIWRSTFQRLKFKPEQGLEVMAKGRVTTYPDKSKYQIVIDELDPAGIGALMALLEQRKKMLAAEGLFHEARKKKLPYLPRIVGVVTSPTASPAMCWCGRSGCRARPAPPRWRQPSPASTPSCSAPRCPGPTSSSWRAAAAASRICGASTRRSWRVRWRQARSR